MLPCFFTLSGFLITYLLLKEKQKSRNEQIAIKKFYIRRILRIWPLYYFYLAICVAVYILFDIDYSSSSLPFYILLLANVPFILSQYLPFAAHLWSIAVEEQFYLFWPWFARLKEKSFFKSMLILLVSLQLLKYVFYFLSIKYQISIPLIAITTNRFTSMIFGSIVAYSYFKKFNWVSVFSSKLAVISSWIVVVLAFINKFNISSALIDHEVLTIVTAIIIISQIERKNLFLDLDAKPFDFLGKISYGLYVYHPLVIFMASRWIAHFSENIWYNYLIFLMIVFSATVLISYASFHLFEKKFIQLKSKYSVVHSKA